MAGTPLASDAPILVVDDSEDARAALRECLESEGYAAIEASNGRAALDFLTARGAQQPRLIVCDLEMPVMSGLELLMILKSYQRLASIPVIVVSGYDAQRQYVGYVAHRAVVASFSKPLAIDAFTATVKEHAGTAHDAR